MNIQNTLLKGLVLSTLLLGLTGISNATIIKTPTYNENNHRFSTVAEFDKFDETLGTLTSAILDVSFVGNADVVLPQSCIILLGCKTFKDELTVSIKNKKGLATLDNLLPVKQVKRLNKDGSVNWNLSKEGIKIDISNILDFVGDNAAPSLEFVIQAGNKATRLFDINFDINALLTYKFTPFKNETAPAQVPVPPLAALFLFALVGLVAKFKLSK